MELQLFFGDSLVWGNLKILRRLRTVMRWRCE